MNSHVVDALLQCRFDTVGVHLHVDDGLVDAGADESVDGARHRRFHRSSHGLRDQTRDLALVDLVLVGHGGADGVVDGAAFWGEILHDAPPLLDRRRARPRLQIGIK